MNLNQGTNKKMRKTHRSVYYKGIKKGITLERDGVQMRDRPKIMTCNPKLNLMNRSELSSGDPRRRLIIRVNRMLDQWHPKSSSHCCRSNGVLITPYPTSHKSVGIIGLDKEVRIELSNQGSRRRMRNVQQRKPTPTLKVSPNLTI